MEVDNYEKMMDEKPQSLVHPEFDPVLATYLPDILSQMNIPLTHDLIEQARHSSELGTITDADITRGGAFTFEEIIIPPYFGISEIPAIICRPTASVSPHPVIFNIHGGGMVAGHYRTAELASELNRAQIMQMAIVSPNYRLAPENPDPAPVDDCYRSLVWLVENAKNYRIDPNRIIISGNSAGGGLAAGVTLMCRDKNGPRLLGQMLQCPMLDDRCSSFSHMQMKGVGLWESTSNQTGWEALLGKRRGSDEVSYYAAPARAKDLSRLPPTFIDVGVVEALRDDAYMFANRIWQVGGDAEIHVWRGAFHSFDQWVPHAEISKAADLVRVSWMRRVLEAV